MTDNTPPKNTAGKQAVLLTYLMLFVAVGLLTMWSILRIPGEANGSYLLGLSVERALLLSSVLVVTAAAAWLLIKSRFNRVWFAQFTGVILARLEDERIYGGVLILSILGVLNGSNFILLIPEITEPVTLAYYVRLQPVVLWIAVLCGLTIIGIHTLRYGFDPRKLKLRDPGIYTFGLAFGFLILLVIWIRATGFGITPIDEGIGWYPLGTPLLSTQVFMAWGISLSTLLIWAWTSRVPREGVQDIRLRVDVLLGVLLWLAAFVLWTSQPLKPNWFASEPRAPNFEFYPNSDASVYDITAQNLSLGEGFKTRGSPFTLRPVYALFLAGLHVIGGASYEPIIWMQVAVLALMPVFLYRMTARIYNRFSGLLCALLLILREANAIKLGDTISDAHAKLLMPFLPTTFGVLLTILVIVTWLQNPSKRVSLPLITGGLVGIFMLIRPEFGVLLPFFGLAALLQLRRRPLEWARGMVLIALGLGLSLSPWIWRNYQLTGTIFIDSPHYRLDLLTKRYREEPLGFVPTTVPGTTQGVVPTATGQPAESSAKTQMPAATPTGTSGLTPQPGETIQNQTGRLVKDVIDFVEANPAYMTNFILNHFLNSQVQTVLNLPVSYPFTYSAISSLSHKSLDQFWLDCCTLTGYEKNLPFWPKWDGVLPRGSIVPLSLNLFLVALGISTAWRKQKFTGLIPLFAAFGYYLINAIVRNSGGRYILPIDWIAIFYFGIGITQITLWGVSFFSRHPGKALAEADQSRVERGDSPVSRWHMLGIACGILLLGCLPPILEIAIPSRFGNTSLENMLPAILESEHPLIDDAEITILETFLENNGRTLHGIALYPRFHKPYQMGSVWYFYQDRPFTHVDFYLSSPHDTGIVLPITETPASFPHATNALVFACPRYIYYDALAVILFTDEGNPTDVLWRSPLPDTLTCPLPPP